MLKLTFSLVLALASGLASQSGLAVEPARNALPERAAPSREPDSRTCCFDNYDDADAAGEYSVSTGAYSDYDVVYLGNGWYELQLWR